MKAKRYIKNIRQITESFALIEDLANISKEDQKKLSGENNNYLNNIKKNVLRTQKKMGGEYKEYKANNRKKEEKELEEDLNKIEEYRKKKQEVEESKNLSKKIKKKDESDEEIDIIELY